MMTDIIYHMNNNLLLIEHSNLLLEKLPMCAFRGN
jgi:hypothetical protein